MQTGPDGTVLSNFVNDRPTKGITPKGQTFDITYDANGNTTQTYPDHTVVEIGKASRREREKISVVAVSLKKNNDRPTKGITPKGQTFDITYDANGNTTQTYPDHTVVVFDKHGHPIMQTGPDGSVLSNFVNDRPTKGITPKGQTFDITYDANGNITQTYADHTVVVFDKDGHPIMQIEIGRASCRERVKISVAAVSLKKNKT